MTSKRAARSVLAIVVGIVFVSAVVEALEFALVTAINGARVTDPETYYGIRNLPWFLAAKLLYNSLAAVGAGFLTAVIAGYAQVRHGLVLALLQTAAFGWALTQPEMSRWTPGWMWAALIILTFAGIIFGARIRAARAGASRP